MFSFTSTNCWIYSKYITTCTLSILVNCNYSVLLQLPGLNYMDTTLGVIIAYAIYFEAAIIDHFVEMYACGLFKGVKKSLNPESLNPDAYGRRGSWSPIGRSSGTIGEQSWLMPIPSYTIGIIVIQPGTIGREFPSGSKCSCSKCSKIRSEHNIPMVSTYGTFICFIGAYDLNTKIMDSSLKRVCYDNQDFKQNSKYKRKLGVVTSILSCARHPFCIVDTRVSCCDVTLHSPCFLKMGAPWWHKLANQRWPPHVPWEEPVDRTLPYIVRMPCLTEVRTFLLHFSFRKT